MSYSKTSNVTISIIFKISAGVFLASIILNLIREFTNYTAIIWSWKVVFYISFAVFAYLLFQTKNSFPQAQEKLNQSVILILTFILFDLVHFLGSNFGWLLSIPFLSIGLFFCASLIHGIAFTLVYHGFRKVNKNLGNPIYILFGWAKLLFDIIYFSLSYSGVRPSLSIGFYTELVLLAMVCVVLFLSSTKILSAQKIIAPAQPYQSVQPYQPVQPYHPAQPQSFEEIKPEGEKPAKSFCTSCGFAMKLEEKFCINCGASK
ncbi:MAG: zinc ribbon domain-containing protein [Candidatus Heimdallarchaeota archaeon]|nr:zinc ribbon domain-containing protein [Candidatus Heimdallarchaeota archaeon]